jgi:hypothetical protein
MKLRLFVLIICLLFPGNLNGIFAQFHTDIANEEDCTIGVASGKATPDGRPMIWKTRDTSAKDNEVYYNTNKGCFNKIN